jgi:transcriptional regulator with XRE-family HTH domain
MYRQTAITIWLRMAGRKQRDVQRFQPALRELGKRIAEHRRKRGWTQDRLAQECAMSGTAIGEFERATAFMSVTTLLVIAHALGLRASELLDALDFLVGDPSIDFEDDEELPF